MNSVLEGIYHGVPTLVIGGTMDANDNALRLQAKGMGKWLHGPTLTANILSAAITELLQDSRLVLQLVLH